MGVRKYIYILINTHLSEIIPLIQMCNLREVAHCIRLDDAGGSLLLRTEFQEYAGFACTNTLISKLRSREDAHSVIQPM